MSDEAKIAESMRKARRRNRGYADYFRGQSKGHEERSIAYRLLVHLNKELRLKWEYQHRGHGQDPPDCEAIAEDGRRIGIEVTELVDQHSLEEVVRGGADPLTDWGREKLVAHVQRLLDRKDAPDRVQGGPYREYLLAIHTDEPALTADNLERLLLGHTFLETRLITAAFLIASFDPRRNTSPVIELRLGSARVLKP